MCKNQPISNFALKKYNDYLYKMELNRLLTISAITIASLATINAQEVTKKSRVSLGGYGEIAYTRNFFSDHVSRYSQPEEHKDDPSHGRFDIPHAVIYLGYNL